MFGWFKKKTNDNIYTVLNDELKRLHEFLNLVYKGPKNSDVNNAAPTFARITKIQDTLIETLKKQPTSDEQIKDLQDSVADLYLAGNDDDKVD